MARLGFCGACPTETETSRREAGSMWALRPALPRARRGGGAPSAQVTAHLQPPIIGNPLTSKFRFYHPYTLTPQNDRLDVAIKPCILVFVIYGRFK